MSTNERDLDSPEGRKANQTGVDLEIVLEQVLAKWLHDDEELPFPEPLDFGNGVSLSGLKKSVAVRSLVGGIYQGHLSISVSVRGNEPLNEDPNSFYDVAVLSLTPETESPVIVNTIFPNDFFDRCKLREVNPRSVVQSSIVQLLYEDAALQRDRIPQTAVTDLPNIGTLVTIDWGDVFEH